MDEKVSVIVPMYNREALISRCLDSIAAQEWPGMEIIVVDNDSSDGSMDVALDWARRNGSNRLSVKVFSCRKRGACAARNHGLSVASGEFVIFFDSDDAMRPGLVRSAINVFRKDEKLDVVCWPCCIHKLDGTLRIPPFHPERPMESHMIHTLLRPQGYMARKQVFIHAGGWNEELPGWNDWELGVRILLKDYRIGYVDEVLADIYAQNESITGSDFSSKSGVWEKSLDAAKEAVTASYKNEKEKRRLQRVIAYREIILAAHYSREGSEGLAKDLKTKALASPYVKHLRRAALLLAYAYTRQGGRGAWRLLRHLL